MNSLTFDQRMAQVSRRSRAAQRQQHLKAIGWQAYRRAQYWKYGTHEVPAGLDVEEREAYRAGMAGGDSDRRQA